VALVPATALLSARGHCSQGGQALETAGNGAFLLGSPLWLGVLTDTNILKVTCLIVIHHFFPSFLPFLLNNPLVRGVNGYLCPGFEPGR
jgi:hypothetical protein